MYDLNLLLYSYSETIPQRFEHKLTRDLYEEDQKPERFGNQISTENKSLASDLKNCIAQVIPPLSSAGSFAIGGIIEQMGFIDPSMMSRPEYVTSLFFASLLLTYTTYKSAHLACNKILKTKNEFNPIDTIPSSGTNISVYDSVAASVAGFNDFGMPHREYIFRNTPIKPLFNRFLGPFPYTHVLPFIVHCLYLIFRSTNFESVKKFGNKMYNSVAKHKLRKYGFLGGVGITTGVLAGSPHTLFITPVPIAYELTREYGERAVARAYSTLLSPLRKYLY